MSFFDIEVQIIESDERYIDTFPEIKGKTKRYRLKDNNVYEGPV